MITPRRSKVLLFVFVTFLAGPAVSRTPDQTVGVYLDDNGLVSYKTLTGNNKNGYIFIDGDQEVLWSCIGHCDELTINLNYSGLACTNNGTPGAPGPIAAKTITCDVDSGTIVNTCHKSAVGTKCAAYSTTVYYGGKKTTDDPEFIVDDSGLRFKTRLGLGALLFFGALGGGIFLGRRWGKARTS